MDAYKLPRFMTAAVYLFVQQLRRRWPVTPNMTNTARGGSTVGQRAPQIHLLPQIQKL